MRIGIEINGVLRDTIGKITQVYQKNLIDTIDEERFEKTYELDVSGNTEEISEIVPFEYKINLPVDSLEISNHFIFQNKEEEYSFLFEDYVMEIFGHASSSEYTTFNDLNDVYVNLRDKHDFIIVSDEIGKSKPASLFFLSKFGCQLEKVKFYSNYTINSMWDEIDILLTSNPSLLLEHPSDKLVIKFETEYNKKIDSIHTITSMKEFEEKLKEIIPC
ncbi:MAG: hypothetical protein RLZ10_1757 [Bacteroidota bacterium]|jgi:hypothetical protein